MGFRGKEEAEFYNFNRVPSTCLWTNHALSAKLG